MAGEPKEVDEDSQCFWKLTATALNSFSILVKRILESISCAVLFQNCRDTISRVLKFRHISMANTSRAFVAVAFVTLSTIFSSVADAQLTFDDAPKTTVNTHLQKHKISQRHFLRSNFSSYWSMYFFQIQLIEEAGYPAEKHPVTTEDGYILELHRIPYGLASAGINSSHNARRTPVLLQHGFECSSASWVLSGPRKGLGPTNESSFKKVSTEFQLSLA